ncbi:hypothetical protein BD770DRAFT_392500 [Pilaira anomala]|nr:hypothetical protein BD770DRAFT_392500 [Pilaira anomala]
MLFIIVYIKYIYTYTVPNCWCRALPSFNFNNKMKLLIFSKKISLVPPSYDSFFLMTFFLTAFATIFSLLFLYKIIVDGLSCHRLFVFFY